VRRIGFVTVGVAAPPIPPLFLEALGKLGWVEGETLAIEWRGGRPDTYGALAQELAALPVELIVAGNDIVARAALDAGVTVPIVVAYFSGDPVAQGLVAGLARPGGTLTGVGSQATQLSGKRVELLHEAVSDVTRLGFLFEESLLNAGPALAARDDLRETQRAAEALGLTFLPLGLGPSYPTLPELLDGAVRTGAEALVVANHRAIGQRTDVVLPFLLEHRLPAMFANRGIAALGGLMAVDGNLREVYERAADQVDRILNGAKPADLPVARVTTFDLIINVRTAEAIGLAIPPAVLAHATEVIR